MDRWKGRGAKSQTGAESEGRKVRREKVRRKKLQVCEKVGKSRNTVFFRCFVAPEGRKVGSLKRRVRRHLGRWEMKSCTPLWREADFEMKRHKTPGSRSTFGSWDVKKVHAVVARSTFRSSDAVSRGRRKGFRTSSKVSKTWGFCSISKNDGRHGTFEEDPQRCIFRGRRSTKDMFMRDVRRSGRWFPERGYILEYQMCRFAKMTLRDRCSTSYDLALISVAGAVL